MKRLLLWMLLAGSLAMGQDTMILKNGQQHQVRLIEIRENSAFIEIKGGHLGAESIVQRVSLKVIDKIILKDGTIAWTALAIDTGPKTVIAPQDSSQIAATKDHLRTQTEGADASFTTLKLPSVEESIAKMADSHMRIAKVIEERWLFQKVSALITFVFYAMLLSSLT